MKPKRRKKISVMNEPVDNVECVCRHCAPKPDPRYREISPEEFIGLNCKLDFPCEDTVEHMWVRCVGLAEHDGELRGVLVNHPVLAHNVQAGDWIEFSRSEIEAVDVPWCDSLECPVRQGILSFSDSEKEPAPTDGMPKGDLPSTPSASTESSAAAITRR